MSREIHAQIVVALSGLNNQSIYQSIIINQDVFNVLPLTALVGGRILCMHGGLSQFMSHSDGLGDIERLPRPNDPPDRGLACDILWADPSKVLYEPIMNHHGQLSGRTRLQTIIPWYFISIRQGRGDEGVRSS